MAKKTDDQSESTAASSLVHMHRDPVYGEPTTADVHPDEVANWQDDGWVVDE